jgi:undecaprenyl-diphosphatase
LTGIQAFILGLIQGLAEFLPISSSGHLVLFQKLFGLGKGVVTFDIAVHLATLAALMIILKKDIMEIIRKPFGKLTLMVVAGTIPTIIIGAVFKDLFDKLFVSGNTLGLEFILTGAVLWYAENTRTKNKDLDRMTYTDAAVIGTAQGIAILPAVSRSGLTIAGALLRGLDREFALKYSFLLSIPAILGAALLDGYDIVKSGSIQSVGIDTLPLVIGMATAAVAGYFTVKFMLRVFSKTSFKVFSYYVFILGGLILLDQLFFGRFFERLF